MKDDGNFRNGWDFGNIRNVGNVRNVENFRRVGPTLSVIHFLNHKLGVI